MRALVGVSAACGTLASSLTAAPLQGLSVLLLHCVLNPEVRKHLKEVLAGKKPHPDDSATTRATLLTVGGAQGHHRAWGLGCPAHRGSVGLWIQGLGSLAKRASAEPSSQRGITPGSEGLSQSQPPFKVLGDRAQQAKAPDREPWLREGGRPLISGG